MPTQQAHADMHKWARRLVGLSLPLAISIIVGCITANKYELFSINNPLRAFGFSLALTALLFISIHATVCRDLIGWFLYHRHWRKRHNVEWVQCYTHHGIDIGDGFILQRDYDFYNRTIRIVQATDYGLVAALDSPRTTLIANMIYKKLESLYSDDLKLLDDLKDL